MSSFMVGLRSAWLRRSLAEGRLVAVVVVFVPIALGVPAVFVFIPPAMLLAPATLARCVQLAALVIGLAAIASMMFDGFVEFMFLVGDVALAAVDVLGVKSRHREGEDCGEQCA
jgi:hypothetical protein